MAVNRAGTYVSFIINGKADCTTAPAATEISLLSPGIRSRIVFPEISGQEVWIERIGRIAGPDIPFAINTEANSIGTFNTAEISFLRPGIRSRIVLVKILQITGNSFVSGS